MEKIKVSFYFVFEDKEYFKEVDLIVNTLNMTIKNLIKLTVKELNINNSYSNYKIISSLFKNIAARKEDKEEELQHCFYLEENLANYKMMPCKKNGKPNLDYPSILHF